MAKLINNTIVSSIQEMPPSHQCQTCGLFLDSNISLETHLMYHNKNMYQMWEGTQKSPNNTNNNNETKLSSETTMTPAVLNNSVYVPETTTQLFDPTTTENYYNTTTGEMQTSNNYVIESSIDCGVATCGGESLPDSLKESVENDGREQCSSLTYYPNNYSYTGFAQNLYTNQIANEQYQYQNIANFYPHEIQNCVPEAISSCPPYEQPQNQCDNWQSSNNILNLDSQNCVYQENEGVQRPMTYEEATVQNEEVNARTLPGTIYPNRSMQSTSSTSSRLPLKRQKTYNCSACNDWFTSSGHLKRHYTTMKHKNKVQSSGQPDPAFMDTTVHNNHHPNGHATQVGAQHLHRVTAMHDSLYTDPVTPSELAGGRLPSFAELRSENKENYGPENKNLNCQHKCHICKKNFNKVCYLTQHNNTHHSGAKPFKCDRCGKRFSDSVTLKSHHQKHAENKPHKCTECSKSFNYKTDLRRHMCLHLNSKPYICNICAKDFIRHDHMVKHSETHFKKSFR